MLPGETMKVFILKEGKEYNQGVAYLNDGTMVVVDNARKMIGKTIDISVTSVLQTTAGKMIFGKWDERAMARTEPRPAVVITTTTTIPNVESKKTAPVVVESRSSRRLTSRVGEKGLYTAPLVDCAVIVPNLSNLP